MHAPDAKVSPTLATILGEQILAAALEVEYPPVERLVVRVAEHRADAVPVHPPAGGATLARLGYRRCSRRAGGTLTGRAFGHAGVALAGAAVGGVPGGGVRVDSPVIAGTCRRGVGLSTARC